MYDWLHCIGHEGSGQVTNMMHNTWDSLQKKNNYWFFLFNYYLEMEGREMDD